MINKYELRVGNLAYGTMYPNQLLQIKTIHETVVYLGEHINSYDTLQPIPLTHETAKRLGLQVDAYCVWCRIELPNSPNVLTINISGGMGSGTVWLRNSIVGVNLPSVIYVHQLQNLYFALTGEELTFKP